MLGAKLATGRRSTAINRANKININFAIDSGKAKENSGTNEYEQLWLLQSNSRQVYEAETTTAPTKLITPQLKREAEEEEKQEEVEER